MGLTPEQTAAVAGILGTVIVAGIKGIWVFGWTYQKAIADAEFWRSTALKSMGHTDHAVNTASSAIGIATGDR